MLPPRARRRHTMPLYAQVANTLRGEIEAGTWSRGQQLPAIDDLAARFNVARATMRQAIEILEAEDLVRRRHGLGTFVESEPREQRWLPLASDWTSFVRMVEPLQPKLILVETAERQPRILEGEGRPASAYQHIKRVHFRDDEPFCLIDIYLAADIYLRAPEQFRTQIVVPLLASMPDVTIGKVHQTLSVDGAGQETAERLDLPLGAPVANVRRTIADRDGTCIYVGDVTYRGDVVRLEIDLSPTPGGDKG
ncbi:MAG: GntR family transcriptional regulator [Rhodospirillales bacterium CG15_BIG_FIL_POST_REV_8_21_14_020_66_15]|nr:MAG: GntR family transcriptional regulator [Rhodospirillales bacterium CG15_BIG_FIL_POST_REV_8_21_14_020_66_15]